MSCGSHGLPAIGQDAPKAIKLQTETVSVGATLKPFKSAPTFHHLTLDGKRTEDVIDPGRSSGTLT